MSPTGTVYFQLDAPFCGFSLPATFAIDGQLVGVDTFRVNIPNPHLRTRGFTVPPGDHLLTAVDVQIPSAWTPVTRHVDAGASVIDTLSFYCS